VSEAERSSSPSLDREFLNAVLENVGEGIVACDADGRLSVINRATREIHGIALADVTQGEWAERYSLFHADGVTPLHADEVPLARALAGETVEKQEIVIAPRGQPARRVLCSGRALRAADGTLLGAVIAMHDVTDERRISHELRKALDDAERASRAKSEFLSRASHELRTPLNSVIGFANILKRNKQGHLTQNELNYVERIARNGQHLLALVNDLLDLSKIEAGRLTLELTPVSLFDLFHEVSDVLATRAQQFGLELKIELPDVREHGDFTIITDEQRLRQVLINLAGNAVKYTRTGSVTLRLRSTDGGWPTAIEIEDTGPGIAAEKLVSIFDAFSTGDAIAQGDHATGLGLAITKSLCAEMGYALSVASTQGTGTTFVVGLGQPTPP
jgi:PAS domain S-box-containing protein